VTFSVDMLLGYFTVGSHENPELIWNDDAREKVSATVKAMKDE